MLNLRAIQAEDLAEIIEVRGATRENAISRQGLYSLGITEETCAVLLQTTHRGWLAEVDERIVGFAIGDGRTGELWVIAVLPGYEAWGVGSSLLREVENWLQSLGWTELWLWTSADQKKRAYSFYRKRGWTPSEVVGDRLTMKKFIPIPASETTKRVGTVG